MESEKKKMESVLTLMIKQSMKAAANGNEEEKMFLEIWDEVAKEKGLPTNQEILEKEKIRLEEEAKRK